MSTDTLVKVAKKIAPLASPMLPPVHQDFIDWAAKQEVSVEHVIHCCLYGRGGYHMEFSANKARDKKLAPVVPGHRWYSDAGEVTQGPEPCEIMLMGKMINMADVEAQRVYAGDMGGVLLTAMRGAGWKDSDLTKMFLSTVLKTEPLDWTKSTLPVDWINAQRMLWMQELMLVRPKYVLLQGAEAVKAVLGTRAKMTALEGKTVVQTFDMRASEDAEPDLHTITFFVCVSPGAVLHDRARPGSDTKYRTAIEQRLHQQLKFFRQTVKGDGPSEGEYEYVVIRDTVTLEAELQKMRDECENGLVGWDAEWQGEHPQDDDHYLRCVQFAYKENHGAVIALTTPGGRPSMKRPVEVDGRTTWTTEGANEEVCRLCKKYMKGLRVVGHFFVADLEMLVPFGLDLREEYDAADNWKDIETKGGVATELLAHAWDETAKFSLDDQIMTHLDIPKYSAGLGEYKAETNRQNLARKRFDSRPFVEVNREYRNAKKKLLDVTRRISSAKRRDSKAVALARARVNLVARKRVAVAKRHKQILETHAARDKELVSGYGWMSDKVLYFYAAWDATAELLLARKYLSLIRSDRHGNDCRRAYWISHRAALAVLEINSSGMLVDRDRLDELAVSFTEKRDELLAKVREYLNWPDFNPRSRFEFAEALFGEEHNGHLQAYGKKKRLRPPGAKTVRAEPLRATGKYPVEWSVVRAERKQRKFSPNTSKQTLGEMFYLADRLRVRRQNPISGEWQIVHENCSKIVGLMRDYRYMDQALKSLLREPNQDITGEYALDDDEENLEYDKGIATAICGDGRVRTHVIQTAETGRWASRRPPLQNCSKAREADFKRIFGDKRCVSARSIFQPLYRDHPESGGEDWFLVESDYSGAELLTAAIMAQDDVMLDHCLRNNLPDDHPNFFDIHSNLTVKAFRLDCAPTKEGLYSLGKVHLRTVAKSIVFGSLYGRGAKAIAIAVRQEGVFITEDDARQMQKAFFEEYSQLLPFFDSCKKRVDVGWICNMFGRYRRFPYTNDRMKHAAYEREAMNATIQGGVADAMSLACRNITQYRDAAEMRFQLVLQIHDAVILHVPASELEAVVNPNGGVLKSCMVDAVPLSPTDLDGKRLPGVGTYRYGSSIDIYDRWGEAPDPDRFIRNGLDPAMAGTDPAMAA